MKPLRIVEFSLGVLVVIASAGIWVLSVSSKNPLEWISLEWAVMFLIYTIFPIVVMAGSYGHAFRKRENGFYFLLAAAFTMFAPIISLFVMIELTGGIAFGTELALLIPPFLAVCAALTAVLVRHFESRIGITSGDTLDGLP